MPKNKSNPQSQKSGARGGGRPDELEPLEPNTLIIENEALRKGFTVIPNYILRNPEVTVGAKMTYVLLLSYAWQEGSCFPGQERLARDLGVHKRSVVRFINELEKKKFISRHRRGLGKTNVYHILDYKPEGGFSDRSDNLSLQEVTENTHQEVTKSAHNKYSVYKYTEQQQVVVDKLLELGIDKEKSNELVTKFPPEHIEEKIEFLEWKLDPKTKTRGKPIQDPAGWLIRAVQKDWHPPPKFRTRAQREAEEVEKDRRRQEAAQTIEEQEKERQAILEEERQKREMRLESLKAKHGADGETARIWAQALERASPSLGVNAHFLADSHLLTVEGDNKLALATIAVTSGFVQQALGEAGQQSIARALAESLEKDRVRLKFVVV